MRAKEALQRFAFPHPHTAGDPPLVVVTPSACARLCTVQNAFQFAQLVGMGIIPFGIDQHRGGKQLRARQFAFASRDRALILCQPPPCIKGLAKDARFMSGKDGLKSHLAADGVNACGTLKQLPRADRIDDQADTIIAILWAKIPFPQSLRRFRVGFDQHPHARVFLLGKDQHFTERAAVGTTGTNRGIATCLVNHQHIARVRQGQVNACGIVFRQMRCADAINAVSRAV